MNSLNSVLLEGNLVKDPTSKQVTEKLLICKFSVAVNRSYKKDDEYVEEVSYFDIETVNVIAESCIKHLTKGRGVRVVGRMKQDRWENEAGVLCSRIKIIAEHVEFKPVTKIS